MAAIWTQADVDALSAAIATGVLTVKYEGPPAREQTFQSIDAMRRLLAEMVRQVQQPTAFRLASFSGGFNPPRSF